MLSKKSYVNGQKVYELDGDTLTFFYKTGKLKAKGPFINEQMEGEWLFYRETGQLWQIGNFKNSKKHGLWVRYDKNDQVEYQEAFAEDKVAKKK
jgi:antitoxin component YwqK of YwqJK toxin-antitoxin module